MDREKGDNPRWHVPKRVRLHLFYMVMLAFILGMSAAGCRGSTATPVSSQRMVEATATPGSTRPPAAEQVATVSEAIASPTAEVTQTATLTAVEATATDTPKAQGTIVPAPTWTDPKVTLPQFPQGAMALLSVPSIGASWAVFDVSWKLVTVEGQTVGQWQQAETGAGHCLGSASPGEQGNCVISLGSGAGSGLERIEELGSGDEIMVAQGAEQWIYRIVSVAKVREIGASLAERQENALFMAPSDDVRLTLIACWPGWACTHRLVLAAVR